MSKGLGRIPFLTARWSNLILLSYAVPQGLLRPHLPAGLELDLLDGQAFVSLVAFDFLETRVLGVGWPGFRNFPELNLRFYVRRGPERGVAFVRELVPQRFVAFVARALYNEPYATAAMVSDCAVNEQRLMVNHRLRFGGREHNIAATGQKPAFRPARDSIEHFFKEHQWGFGRTRKGHSVRYEVSHPEWDVYPVVDWHMGLECATLYGPEWGFLNTAKPYSTVLAVGSAVQVYPWASPF